MGGLGLPDEEYTYLYMHTVHKHVQGYKNPSAENDKDPIKVIS